jgi:hypothetical protein
MAAGGSPARTVVDALRRWPSPLLVTTADHPLLTPGMVERLLREGDPEADAVVALVPAAAAVVAIPEPAGPGCASPTVG